MTDINGEDEDFIARYQIKPALTQGQAVFVGAPGVATANERYLPPPDGSAKQLQYLDLEVAASEVLDLCTCRGSPLRVALRHCIVLYCKLSDRAGPYPGASTVCWGTGGR